MIVSVENKNIEFPDDMPPTEIESVIKNEFYPKEQPSVGISMPKVAPEETPPIKEQMKVKKAIEERPAIIAEEIRKRALELQRERMYGTISEEPYSIAQSIRNIPKNMKEITNSFSSLIVGSGMFAYKFGKNLIKDSDRYIATGESDYPETVEQFKPATDLIKAIGYDWQSIFAGETPEEIAKLPAGQALTAMTDYIKEVGLTKTMKYFIRDNPVDAMLLGYSLYRTVGAGTRLSMEGVDALIPKATKFSSKLDEILSTKRTPIIYNIPAEKDGIVSAIKTLEFPREYAKDPLTKYIFEKSFDAMLDNFPTLKSSVSEHKAKKLLNTIRNLYEDANFKERASIHAEIFEQVNKLSKEEQAIAVPYLEGRVSLIDEPSEKFVNFENWYRALVKNTETDLIERGKLTLETVKNRMYQPLAKATGQTTEQVIEQFGNFKPVYVHHTFPKIYSEKTGIHFAETTGQRFKPGFLKKSRGATGYSEDLKEILPKWTSEYIKFKNTEAFINEFTSKFGIKVNIKDIKEVEGGLKVGDTLYKDYKIVAPDGYLSFYKQKVDFYKEVSKRMETATFDEAIGDVLSETIVSKGAAGISKAEKLIEDRVAEALTTRGFSSGETAQMINRIKSGEATETIIKETIIKKGIAREDVENLFQGVIKEFVGVSKNKPVYLIPKAMSKELESFAAPFMGSQKAQDVVRLLVDKPTQVWKDSVLSLTPRWVKNNVVGDIIFNTFEGVGPLSYSRAFKTIYKDTIPDELLSASFANVMKYNPKLGSTAQTTIGGLVDSLYKTKVVEGIAKIKDTGYALNTMFEQPFVRALYVKLAREKAISILKSEGLSPNEVNILNKMRAIKGNSELVAPLVSKVQETLPVFNLTGNWERKYIRRFVPFYNWYKFMIQYSSKLPKNHPFKTVGARGLGEFSENQREETFKEYFPFMQREIEDNGIPERFGHLWPVGEIGTKETSFFNARGLNVFTTIEDFANLDIINMMSPVIIIPLEQITGKAVFGDRDFKSGEEGIEFTYDGVKYNDFEKVRPPLVDHILSQFPQYSLLKQMLVPARQWDTGTVLNPDPILDPITGEYKYPIDNIEKILNYSGIDKKTLDVREVWNKYQQRKWQALGKAAQKYQSKIQTALSFEDIRGIVNEIKKDTVLWSKIQEEMKSDILYKKEQSKELMQKIKAEEK